MDDDYGDDEGHSESMPWIFIFINIFIFIIIYIYTHTHTTILRFENLSKKSKLIVSKNEIEVLQNDY